MTLTMARSTTLKAPHYALFSSPLLLRLFIYKYFPQHLTLKQPQTMTFLHVRTQVSYPYKTINKIIVFLILDAFNQKNGR
jgi:hypothetical protein